MARAKCQNCGSTSLYIPVSVMAKIRYSSYAPLTRVISEAEVAEILEQEEKTGGWIPVSDRLPEEAYGCLVTVMDYEPSTQTDFENILPYFVGYDGHGWNDADGEKIPFDVIAWMPLPDPYRESEE